MCSLYHLPIDNIKRTAKGAMITVSSYGWTAPSAQFLLHLEWSEIHSIIGESSCLDRIPQIWQNGGSVVEMIDSSRGTLRETLVQKEVHLRLTSCHFLSDRAAIYQSDCVWLCVKWVIERVSGMCDRQTDKLRFSAEIWRISVWTIKV